MLSVDTVSSENSDSTAGDHSSCSDGSDGSPTAAADSDSDGPTPPDSDLLATLGSPLYDNLPLSEGESLLQVCMFATRHGLSDVAVTDLLNLLSNHCPQPNRCPVSLYRYKRITSSFRTTAPSKTHVCGECHSQFDSKYCQNSDCMRYNNEAYKPNVLITLQIEPLLSQLVTGM